MWERCFPSRSLNPITGADPGYSLGGGGGAKGYVSARTLRARNRLTFGRGPCSRVVLMLFRAI